MLVKFFVFHILVLTISFSKVTGAPQSANSGTASFFKEDVRIHSYEDGSSRNTTAFHTQKPMFQILMNLTKSGSNNNLKSNIFDKMLSEEMLSIKQRSFEKDLIQSSTTKKIKQHSAPTPTIEVQQKWSVVELFKNDAFDEPVTQPVEDEDDDIIDIENNLDSDSERHDIRDNMTDNKILELRSLSLARHAERDQNQAQVSSCGGNHMQVTPKCSCSKPDHHRCTQIRGGVTDSGVSYSVYPLYLQPFQTFFFSDNLENPYQHVYLKPDVVNELKIRKKPKLRKTTTVPADLYYEDIVSEIDDEEYSLRPKPKRPNVVMNIEYDLVDDKPKKSNCKHGDGNSFNVINDLNEVFNDRVNKKCYCSLSTLTFTKQSNIMHILTIIVHTLQYLHNINFFE